MCDNMIMSYMHVTSQSDRSGLGYGVIFQGLEGLAWDGANRAIGLVNTCELAQDQYEFSAQPCVIHRVTLDVAAQLI